MATATMGLRRRATLGGDPRPSSSSSSSSNGLPGSSSGGKRARPDNNNSPSQGNLNAEPAAKKTRASAACRDTRSSTKAKEQQEQVKKAPPPWSDRSLASIAGLALGGQGANLQLPESVAALSSPLAFMSGSMATFVGNAAASLAKGSAAAGGGQSYLDIGNVTGQRGWPACEPSDPAKGPAQGLAFPPAASLTAAHFEQRRTTTRPCSPSTTSQQPPPPPQEALPRQFPNDCMFAAYQPWVIRTYGDLAKTKTITIKKYARILRTLRGEEVNSAENSKFRFWVKSKGFHIGRPDGYDAKPADRIVGRHAVSSPGLDPPLYVPTPPPHSKNVNGAEGTVLQGRVYKKVAIVENFFDIIHAVHVDLEGRPGKHAGQKRTYRTITETYAFLPREAVTRFLLGCTECQRRPRTPSPSTLQAVGSGGSKPNTPTPACTPPLPSANSCGPPSPARSPHVAAALLAQDKPPSPKPATAMTSGAAEPAASAERSSPEAPHHEAPKNSRSPPPLPPQTQSYQQPQQQQQPQQLQQQQQQQTPANQEATKARLTRDERYNPHSVCNLLRKDPVQRRPLPTPLPLPRLSCAQSAHAAAAPSACWPADLANDCTAAFLSPLVSLARRELGVKLEPGHGHRHSHSGSGAESASEPEDENFSSAAGLIDTNLNLLATIQQLHCQVMLALTERMGSGLGVGGSATTATPAATHES